MGKHNKMVFAIIQEADYDTTVEQLNEHGFFVTKLSSTGGFLKRKNITIMIGVEEDKVPLVLDILKKNAGKRVETVYTVPAAMDDVFRSGVSSAVPVNTEVGGATFVLELPSERH